MLSEASWSLAAASAAFGLASSLHCGAMCGPLAGCGAGGSGGAALRYQGARLGGYAAAGAMAGAVGAGASAALGGFLGAYVPWVLALVLVLQLLGIESRLRLPASLLARAGRLAQRTKNMTPGARALLIGLLTPLLPCGLLLSVYGLAAASGSAASGALSTAAFALGSAPLLLAAQIGWGRLTQGSLARWSVPARRASTLLAAAVLVWRGWSMASGSCHTPLRISSVA